MRRSTRCRPPPAGDGNEVTAVKVDALKIKEIARKLGVSERTVEEYLLDRLTMQEPSHQSPQDDLVDSATLASTAGRARARAGVSDRLGRSLEKDVG